MANLYDNNYIDEIKKKIMDNDFSTKEDLMDFLKKAETIVLQDSSIQQYFQESFIKLNDETLAQMHKHLLEFYNKRKNNDLVSLELEGVTEVEIDEKKYIKVVGDDGTITMMDNSLGDEKFVDEFLHRQNELSSAQTKDGTKNKEEILEDMEEDKTTATLVSSVYVNTRELTFEEQQQFASVMKMNDADVINFLVDPEKNIYINKNTGELYYAKRNNDGSLEVRKANETGAETYIETLDIADNDGKETTMEYEQPDDEPDYDAMEDSDLEYIVQFKKESISPEKYEKIQEILRKRKEEKSLGQSSPQKNKLYVKVLLKDVGFVSFMTLCSIVSLFGIGLLLVAISKL